MKTDKAKMVFYVGYKGLTYRVRLMENIEAVSREYKATHHDPAARNMHVCAFFSPSVRKCSHVIGTLVFPLTGQLEELIPHEVFHGVLHHFRSVHRFEDEPFAEILGKLSAKIYKKIRKNFYAFDDISQ
jgi:hypothetical protein